MIRDLKKLRRRGYAKAKRKIEGKEKRELPWPSETRFAKLPLPLYHSATPATAVLAVMLVSASQARTLEMQILACSLVIYINDFAKYKGWPAISNGNGKQLVHSGHNLFSWNTNLLIWKIEENLDAQVIDIPTVHKDSNNYVSFGLQSS